MAIELQNYFKSRGFLFLWLLAFALNIITFVLIFYKSGLEGPNVALKYTVRVGVITYGEGKNLYWLPALGLIVNSLNLTLFKKLKSGHNFFLPVILSTSLLVQILLLLSVILLAAVN
jgi:hypothetical protein